MSNARKILLFLIKTSPITMLFVFAIIVIGIISYTNKEFLYRFFYFSSLINDIPFYDVKNGELWRIWTPSLMHGGILHLVFNLMWWLELASQIERRFGAFHLMMSFLVLSAFSNIMQYVVFGPTFLGLSGVVYGLLGYIWMYSRFSGETTLFLNKRDVTFMIIWFVACLIGLIPNVANIGHAAGLSLGMIMGLAHCLLRKSTFLEPKKLIAFLGLALLFFSATYFYETYQINSGEKEKFSTLNSHMKICLNGDLSSCYIAANAAKEASSLSEFESAVKKICELGDKTSCYSLPTFIENIELQTKLYQYGCDLNIAESCHNLSVTAWKNQEFYLAAESLIKACELGKLRCDQAKLIQEELKKQCESNDSRSCDLYETYQNILRP